jgi:hypothetical protein
VLLLALEDPFPLVAATSAHRRLDSSMGVVASMGWPRSRARRPGSMRPPLASAVLRSGLPRRAPSSLPHAHTSCLTAARGRPSTGLGAACCAEALAAGPARVPRLRRWTSAHGGCGDRSRRRLIALIVGSSIDHDLAANCLARLLEF